MHHHPRQGLLVEQINYNLLYRWFVGLTIDDAVWNHSSFTTHRDRLLENDVITELFEEVVGLARKKNLLSDEHFSVDGTLIQAWASQKSYRRKADDSQPPTSGGRNSDANFHGESAAMRLTNQRQMVMHGWPRKVPARKPNSPTWVTLSWRIAMA